MKATASHRDRIRAQLADLKMPGALEASSAGGDRSAARRTDLAPQ
jgi:hypothetical protein